MLAARYGQCWAPTSTLALPLTLVLALPLHQVFPGLSVYSASKFFVEAVSQVDKVGCGNALPGAHSVCFRQGLRLETVGSGVKVTTVQVLGIHST